MHVDHARKLVFIHNPKTGGMSLAKMLDLPEPIRNPPTVHMTVDEAISCFFHQTWSDFFSFSIVRNPWERLVSLYCYQRSLAYGLFAPAGPSQASHQLARSYEFEEWLELNRRGVRRAMWFAQPQTDWTSGVTKVFRFEEWDAMVREVGERYGVTPRSVRINDTPRSHYTEYYRSDQSRAFVGEKEAVTIERFNYRFGD